MNLKKCRKCGCMDDALVSAAAAFSASDEPDIAALAPTIQALQGRMEGVEYNCLGCRKCWGADATKQLAQNFEDVQPDACGNGGGGGGGGGGDIRNLADMPVTRSARVTNGSSWPPYAGDYVLGNLAGSVAVCALSSRDLAAALIAADERSIAIAGRCDTENIGVEKVVLNLLANPAIRALIVCGIEAKGHRTGDAFLRLKEHGVNADMRVLESASWRPVLKNLTLVDVARFREQVEIIDMIGVIDPENIIAAAREFVADPPPPIAAYIDGAPLAFERIRATAPHTLKLDPAGFFIVLPQSESGVILCEHYHNNGRLLNVIEGRRADLIAATAVERGLVTRLDHAAYLGRELAKAEMSMKTGALYEQDAALGNLPTAQISECVSRANARPMGATYSS